MDFNIKDRLLNFVYPPVCVHCQCVLDKRGPIFCAACLEQVSLIDPEGRCGRCFFPLQKEGCPSCSKRPSVIHRQIAACEAVGPAGTLLNGIYNGMRDCIPAAASLMAYQWIKLKIPLPDFLVPLPASFWQKQQHGFDAPLCLAEEVGKILAAPVKQVLQRKFDRQRFFTQAELKVRMAVDEKAGAQLTDKKIALVAPAIDDALFHQIGLEMKGYFPAQIDILAFGMPFSE